MEMPAISEISSYESPSTSFRRNTSRYPSGSASVASWMARPSSSWRSWSSARWLQSDSGTSARPSRAVHSADRSAPELAEVLVSGEEGVLGDLRRVGLAAGHPERQAVDLLLVAADQRLEGGHVAAPRPCPPPPARPHTGPTTV